MDKATMRILNEISVSPKGNLFIGALANKLVHGEKNIRLNNLINIALKDLTLYGRFLVIEEDLTLRAAQSSKENALKYMTEKTILITIGE